jgi:hypothetical protein
MEVGRAERAKSQSPGPFRTIAHVDLSVTPPEAERGFALGLGLGLGLGESVGRGSGKEYKGREVRMESSVLPAGLFSCVWARRLCPGFDADASGDEDERGVDGGEGESEDKSEKESAHEMQEVSKLMPKRQKGKCGRVTGWEVRSCLCSGRVRTASLESEDVDADAVGGRSVERGGLEAECRSMAPVVRYVVGCELCAMCQRRKEGGRR